MKRTLTAVLACSLLAGCATQPSSPENRMFTKEHGVYWHADQKKSLAANAYSLAGVQVNVEEAENASGGVDEGLASKMLLNTATGAITGGLKAGIGMFTASLYSEADAEYLQVPQFVVFVKNPHNLPIDDSTLVKSGASIIIEALKDIPKYNNSNYDSQKVALNQCVVVKSVINKWDTCDTPSAVAGAGGSGKEFLTFQVIRPATGDELSILNLPKGNYSIIRYMGFVPKDLVFDTSSFPGFRLMPQDTRTSPGFASVTINGKEYYFIKGSLGERGFPLKKRIG
ncbi:hypothetical protein [Klebsiella pneumoniae]|uniref:hypothetical protein n=1 Tax=Klebsiella pneumoniae TaxID=573 RepID=UPI00044BE83E|nr:hypothetical protein [Klebsiella pneumoniae]EIW9355057.1 hypothetical protein [Klebsiella pneumoniae]EIW9377994.1 hypothetical protein [Klebsiella pneumoniae]EWE61917.1 hypothetical protein L443_05186 [Klebsiella pneumoniae BIDMC 14]KDH47175.1 hypothetical protein AE55_05454 [Klebsiella pneumoniae BWH 47]KMG39465.1 hypothetical protein SM52_05046 [Klebsiella pneumoniae]